MIATGIISGTFLLIASMLHSSTMQNVPSGATAGAIFAMGLIVFSIFAFFFMVYINNFLIAQRKREFGLYGVLGLEKRHVARVLLWENAITLLCGLAMGAVIALIFGRLLFWILLKLIHTAPGSAFSISSGACSLTLCLFGAVFVVTSLLNLRQVHMASPMELMQSTKKGEKDSKLMFPVTVFGVAALLTAYYYAWTIENPSVALGVFFLLAVLVILATNALFRSGSIVFLKLLRRNKRIYYRYNNFVAIGGMFQRMRQNARSLATVCILSTMLIVTVSGTLSLYLGQEEMLTGMYPYDCSIRMQDPADEAMPRDFEDALLALADKHNVTLVSDRSKLVTELQQDELYTRNNYLYDDSVWQDTKSLICYNNEFRFDVIGSDEDCLAFVKDTSSLSAQFSDRLEGIGRFEVFTARVEGYGLYGGLLFMGAFFGMLFLAVTVLIIYFKQITEGYEDKHQFEILQKVGMDDAQVRSTINRQVLWVFFIPLGTTAVHMVFASRMMARMLQTFMLYDWGLVLTCIGGALVAFALLYLIVYRLTARVYYRIVRC